MLDFLTGAKTFIGGVVLVGGGVAGMAFGLIDPITGVQMVGAGFGLWGIGSKLDRMLAKPVDLKGKIKDETTS